MSCLATSFEILSVSSLFPILNTIVTGSIESEILPFEIMRLDFHPNYTGFSNLIFLFIVLLIFSYFLRYMYLVMQNKLAFGIGQQLADQMFFGITNSSFSEVSKNSADYYVTMATVKLLALVEGLIIPIMSIISSLMMLILITVSIVFFGGLQSLLVLISICFFYLGLMYSLKRLLNKLSVSINVGYQSMASVVSAAKHGFREWKLLGLEDVLTGKFSDAASETLKAQSHSKIISSAPRLIVEPVFIAIGLVAIMYSNGKEGLIQSFPVVAVVVFALQRFMPYIQAAFAGWTYIKSNEQLVNDFLEGVSVGVSEPAIPRKSTSARESDLRLNHIDLRNVFFWYADGKSVFKDFSFRMAPGDSVAVVGASGSGKSTLINLILGFLQPQAGTVYPGILSHGRSGVAYVPQEVFILEASILENIALWYDQKDFDEVWFQQVLSIVELSGWVDSNPQGYEKLLHSDGSDVSGGQRQRIGLARALYSKPEILLLDESTSALDSITESVVLKNLFLHASERGITILFVTHRNAPLAFCDTKIDLSDYDAD